MIKDVYEGVKKTIQERYPKSSEYPFGFEHFLTDSSGSALGYNTAPPRAVWVLPKPGGMQFSRQAVRRVGGNGAQIWAVETNFEIHLWLPDTEDQEESQELERPAGIITEYIRAINTQVNGAGYELRDGGYVMSDSSHKGYEFVLRLMMQFGIYLPQDRMIKIQEAQIEQTGFIR